MLDTLLVEEGLDDGGGSAWVLPEVIADGERAESHAMGTGVAFGESTIGEAEI